MKKRIGNLILVICIVLSFLTWSLFVVEQSMAQAQTSNKTEIIVAKNSEEKANLERFDKLDFEGWNNRNWTVFSEIYDQGVMVSHFNGNVTDGLDNQLKWAKNLVAVQPDIKVISHPIKIATGNWTAVIGLVSGNITMVTLAYWEDGKIIQEYMFWQTPTQ